jgi:hypothetical protein
MIALPIPNDGSIPPYVGILFLIAAAASLVVVVYQAVRYFRRKDDE